MKFVQPIRDTDKIEEIKKVLRERSHRDYLVFLIGINTGLRVGDILCLKVKDVRDKEHIIIQEQKTKKAKRIKITAALRREIKKYIHEKSDAEYLVKSREGRNKPLTRTRVYQILREVAREVGLDEIGTHSMRKTFGYHFYQKYGKAALLQQIFNHSSEAITLRYIGINQDIMDDAIDDFKI